MKIELGDVHFEAEALVKQLRNDLRDDWFPDPLGFADMANAKSVADRIAENFTLNQGRYLPQKRDLYNVPKPNFTLRYALETSLSDRALYHGLVLSLMPFYDRLIPWNAFSHRFDYLSSTSRSPFKRVIPSWKDFVGSVRSAVTPGSYLLSTDLSNYYEHVDIGRLHRTLLALLPEVEASPGDKAKIRARIEMLFSCLGAWTYENERGLPQNRDASSFLANLYMIPVDRAMRLKGYGQTYFRYMDDIKIVCEDRFEARSALKDLILALREIGLAVNSKKTEIIPGADAFGSGGQLSDGSDELQYLDQMWNTRKREAILRCIPRLKKMTLRLIDEGNTDSREFRFCVNRLESLALCDDLYVPETYFEEVTPAMIDALVDNPATTDQFVRYLAAVPVSVEALGRLSEYLSDQKKACYNWQNYRLWWLLTYKGYRREQVLRHACSVILEAPDCPTRAGATLYCGALGDQTARNIVAEHFGQLSTFLGQRTALIAAHELPYHPMIKAYVAPHIRPDLLGVYKQLRQTRGRYYAQTERVPITKMVDLDRDYE
jgi:hypothetical protein